MDEQSRSKRWISMQKKPATEWPRWISWQNVQQTMKINPKISPQEPQKTNKVVGYAIAYFVTVVVAAWVLCG